MNTEFQKRLYQKYPVIFRDVNAPPTQTLICFGVECDDGWFELIDNLCQQLTQIAKITGIQTVATQIKEKFGTLRFYVTYSEDCLSKLSPDEKKFGMISVMLL